MLVEVLCPCCGAELRAEPSDVRADCPECAVTFLLEAAIAFHDARLGRAPADRAGASDDFIVVDGALVRYTGRGGDVRIPQGVRSVGTQAFGGCASLTSVVMPEGLIEVGEGAFARCTALRSVFLPSSVVRIMADAFARCVSLTRVSFAPGVDASSLSIDDDAFYCCGSIEEIEGWDGDLGA